MRGPASPYHERAPSGTIVGDGTRGIAQARSVARRVILRAAWWAVVLVVAGGQPGRSQTDNTALRDRVNQLVERLESPKKEVRQAAEDGLIKLGPRILTLLPEPSRT